MKTTPWLESWHRKLSPAAKCAYRYIVENVDELGVAEADPELLTVLIGSPVDITELAEAVELLPENRVRIRDREVNGTTTTAATLTNEAFQVGPMSEPETVVDPPVTLQRAISRGQEIMIDEDVVTSWWHARDAVGWRRREQPITRWQSDLVGYVRTWQRNEKHEATKRPQRATVEDVRRGDLEPMGYWRNRAPKGKEWSEMTQTTRDRVVQQMVSNRERVI